MRLMPPPLLFQAGGDRVFDLAPAMAGAEIELFYATSRLPVGPRDNRVYSVAPDWRLHLGTAHLRIGDEETTLDQIREWTTRTDGSDRPFIRLERMTEAATLSDPADIPPEAEAWLAEIDAALAASRSRDLLLYVHGANTTVERAAGQAAQLKHFAGREAVVVLFAWPTAENFLRYARDLRTALGSAPQLADLVRLLAARTTPRRSTSSPTPPAPPSAATPSRFSPARPRDRRPPRRGLPRRPRRRLPRLRRRPRRLRPPRPPRHRRRQPRRQRAPPRRRPSTAPPAPAAPTSRELSPDTSARLLAAAADGEIEIVQVHPDRMPELSATSHTFWYDHPWASNDVLLTLLFHLPRHPRPRPRHRPLRRRLLDLPGGLPRPHARRRRCRARRARRAAVTASATRGQRGAFR